MAAPLMEDPKITLEFHFLVKTFINQSVIFKTMEIQIKLEIVT